MAYPHKFNSSNGVGVVRISGACSAGTVTAALNVPHGKDVKAIAFHVDGTANAAVITMAAYVNPAQDAVSPAMYFVEPGDSALAATLTLAATGTTRGTVLTLSPANLAFLGRGFTSVYGIAVTIATTASGGTGSWYVDAVMEG